MMLRTAIFLLLSAFAPDAPHWNHIAGRPTDRSVTISVFCEDAREVRVEYGTGSSRYTENSQIGRTTPEAPAEIELRSLRPNTRYFYRVGLRLIGEKHWTYGEEASLHTQRAPGATFSFGVQGDSHPERLNRMYQPELYRVTMAHVRSDRPDFYVLLGDDFSTDHLYKRDRLNAAEVAQLYVAQRRFLSLAGTPIFLTNGNHEHAERYLLDGTPNNAAVYAGRARNTWFPLPVPDRFYTGDSREVPHVGLPHDYYAWTWGDALFVVIDPYWHSPVQIDSGLAGRAEGERGGGRNRDGWVATMGDEQYQWLRRTLAQSTAKFKFVFAHHVLGTGRGGVELADLYEWGGRGRSGAWEFNQKRPGWEMPVHQLMVKHGVTIFFQGHDHLFARQEKDGVIYQETPNPADSTYTAFNREAYRSGDILPNSGYLRVTVGPEAVQVEYVRSSLPNDTAAGGRNGEVAFRYSVRPRVLR